MIICKQAVKLVSYIPDLHDTKLCISITTTPARGNIRDVSFD